MKMGRSCSSVMGSFKSKASVHAAGNFEQSATTFVLVYILLLNNKQLSCDVLKSDKHSNSAVVLIIIISDRHI